MAEPAWLIYTGAITGIVGCVAGVTGACLGFISYRRSVKFKSLDLRLQLQKAEGDVHAQLVELQAVIGRARKSRTEVAAATYGARSGDFETWRRDVAVDLSKVVDLEERISHLHPRYGGLSHEELEARLVAIHEAQSLVTGLAGKYQAELAADDRTRERRRADAKARK